MNFNYVAFADLRIGSNGSLNFEKRSSEKKTQYDSKKMASESSESLNSSFHLSQSKPNLPDSGNPDLQAIGNLSEKELFTKRAVRSSTHQVSSTFSKEIQEEEK